MTRFFAAIPNLKHRTVLMTMDAAGLRLLEALHLHVADVDSARQCLRVEQGKGQKDRSAAAHVLARHPSGVGVADLTRPHEPGRFRYGTIMEPLMPTLTVKGLPDPIYERLKAQADAHRRSLNGEIIVCLERAVSATRFDPNEWLAEARAFRESLAIEPLTDRELREARRAGRA